MGLFQRASECFGAFWGILEGFGQFWSVSEGSWGFGGFSETFGGFKRARSRRVWLGEKLFFMIGGVL